MMVLIMGATRSWIGAIHSVCDRIPPVVTMSSEPADGSRALEMRSGSNMFHLWDDRELWALEDSVPRYSFDSGRLVLWDRIALDVPELAGRSAEELRKCWLDPPMPLQKGNLEHAAVERPPRLEQWERLPDGTFRGVLYGASGIRDGCVRASLAPVSTGSRAEEEKWCVCIANGDVFQLGAEAEACAPGPLMTQDGILPSVDSLVAATSSAGRTALPAVGAAASSLLAPAAATALLVGGIFIATGGHLHLPHVDINVFVV